MSDPRRGIEERSLLGDEYAFGVSLLLLRAYTWLEDFEAVDREAAAARAMPSVPDPGRLVALRGAQALAWFDAGRLTSAAEAARAADADAKRLDRPASLRRGLPACSGGRRAGEAGFRHGGALPERVLSTSERFRPVFEFLGLLDRAEIWAARGKSKEALASVDAARLVLTRVNPSCWPEPTSWRRCCACRSATCARPPNWRTGFPPPGAACCWPGSRSPPAITAPPWSCLDTRSLGELTPRAALVRQVLLAAAAIERGDPEAAGIVGGLLHAARHEGFFNTVLTTAPQVTRYLVEHSTDAVSDPFLERIVSAALEVRAMQPERSSRMRHRTTDRCRAAGTETDADQPDTRGSPQPLTSLTTQ